ncbi:hypothetical protein ABNP39_08040 [Pantoea dispersa]|uniref:hypothetical protein n=1 Tax=Pantoea dispersa TaxID=59814 RepID=UPI0032EC1BA6
MKVMMTNNFMAEANSLGLKDTSDFAAVALKLSEIERMSANQLQKLKVQGSKNDVYVIKHKSLRIFFTKSEEGVIALSITSFN